MKKREMKNFEKVTSVNSIVHWTDYEKGRFVKAIKKYGRNWSKVTDDIGTRTKTCVKLYAYRLKKKLQSG